MPGGLCLGWGSSNYTMRRHRLSEIKAVGKPDQRGKGRGDMDRCVRVFLPYDAGSREVSEGDVKGDRGCCL